jgi:hypothetical protein
MHPPERESARARVATERTQENNRANHDTVDSRPAQTVRDEVWRALVAVQYQRDERLRQNLARQKHHARWLAGEFSRTGQWRFLKALLAHVAGMRQRMPGDAL